MFAGRLCLITSIFQDIKKQYEEKQAVLGPEQSFMFKDDAISLEIPVNGRTIEKWKVNPTIQPKVGNSLAV